MTDITETAFGHTFLRGTDRANKSSHETLTAPDWVCRSGAEKLTVDRKNVAIVPNSSELRHQTATHAAKSLQFDSELQQPN